MPGRHMRGRTFGTFGLYLDVVGLSFSKVVAQVKDGRSFGCVYLHIFTYYVICILYISYVYMCVYLYICYPTDADHSFSGYLFQGFLSATRSPMLVYNLCL